MSWLRSEVARAPRVYASIFLVIVAALVYANSTQGAFHFDDLHHIVGNPYLRDGKYAQQYLHRPDMFSALPGHNMYRPLVLYSYHLNYRTGGYEPLHWRLTAIALHALTVVGIFLTGCAMARCFSKRRDLHVGALVAALLFAVHPVFTETVNYASARSSLLAACALIWAYWAHQTGLSVHRSCARLLLMGLSLALLCASLLSKEIAVVFPALLLWTAVIRRGGYLAVLPSVVIVGAYLVLRQELLGSAVIDFAAREAAMSTADAGSGGARPILWNLYTQARVICAYLLLFLAPFGLCIHRNVRVSDSPLEAGVIGGVVVITGLLVLAWRLRERRPMVSLGIVWFLVALSPTSSIVPLNQVMNEHRLYLPGIGIALLVGALACGRRGRRIVPVAAVVFAALTVTRNRDWGDPVRLWRSAVAVSPDSDGAWNSFGAQLRGRGESEEAERAFRRALEINPRSWGASFNMGTLYLQRGRESGRDRDLVEAQSWLELSLELRPGAERSRWYLAEVLHAMGRPEQAMRAFGALAGLRPRLYEMTRYPLARIALERGDVDAAKRLYAEALRHGTDPVAALLGQARVSLKEGERDAAVTDARRAINVRPHNPQPHMFLARLYKGTPAGVRYLFEAERRGYRPTDEERRSILGERRP